MPKFTEEILEKVEDAIDLDAIKRVTYEIDDMIGSLETLREELEELYSKAEDVLEESGENDNELFESADDAETTLFNLTESLEKIRRPVDAITDAIGSAEYLYEGEEEEG